MEPPRRVTIYDVAANAGVSQTTVTHVLTGRRPVAPSTKARVLASIAELDYRPNEVARALRHRRTRSVTFVVQNLVFEMSPTIAHHAGAALRREGYAMTVLESDGTVQDLGEVVDTIISRSSDGVLFADFAIPDVIAQELRSRRIPFVANGIADHGDSFWDVVRVDQAHGMQLAVERVAARKSIAYIGGPKGGIGSEEREQGFLMAMTRLGLEVDTDLMARAAAYSWSGGRNAAFTLLDQPAEFAALICANDHVAIGAMSALRDRGRRIPDDVAVTGFDNALAAEMATPALTTVNQYPERIASASVEILLARLRGEATPPQEIAITPELVIRDSA